MKAGVQPLKKDRIPSILYICDMIVMDDNLRSEVLADMIRVLMTSTGEHTVVATKPCMNKMSWWVIKLSGVYVSGSVIVSPTFQSTYS